MRLRILIPVVLLIGLTFFGATGVWAGPAAQTVPTAPPGTMVYTPTPLPIPTAPPPGGNGGGWGVIGGALVLGIGLIGYLAWRLWRPSGVGSSGDEEAT